VIIFFLMMATAFMGYVLPWGQMSFWGATVITGFFSAIPWVGESIQQLLLGGFAVENPTLNRFFSLHYLLPFMIAGVVILHVWALHVTGQTNPTGVEVKDIRKETVPFTPYATIKDALAMVLFFMFFAWFVFYLPDFLGHPDNYVPANPLKTPAHIVPEWYFLPFYAILRAITFNIGIPFTDIVLIDSKLGGVIAMFASIAVLFFLPWLDTSPVKSANYRPLYRQFFWIFVIVCIALGYLGSRPAEGIYPLLSLLFTIYYFAHFFIILPLLGWFETPKERPASIADAVLASQMKHGTSTSAQPAE
jgi:ubiquinol-cytochrome c reductase cytochrome b subunit